MQVQLLTFGVLKDLLSQVPPDSSGPSRTIDLPDHTSVAQLLAILQSEHASRPQLARLLPSIAVSVNAEYAQPNQILREGDLVGLLPPVSGGTSSLTAPAPAATWLTQDPIPASDLIAAAKDASDGAVVVFDGIVRNNTRGRTTLYLDYEAYTELAEAQLAQLAQQAIQNFAIRQVTIVHRLGRLKIGETSVLIIVASAHRAAAYDASRWLIDTLKKTVPIWKKETFSDGACWADGEPFPPELAASPTCPDDEEPAS